MLSQNSVVLCNLPDVGPGPRSRIDWNLGPPFSDIGKDGEGWHLNKGVHLGHVFEKMDASP